MCSMLVGARVCFLLHCQNPYMRGPLRLVAGTFFVGGGGGGGGEATRGKIGGGGGGWNAQLISPLEPGCLSKGSKGSGAPIRVEKWVDLRLIIRIVIVHGLIF